MAASDFRKPPDPHDGSYKSLFDHPRRVRDLLLGFVHEGWVQRLDDPGMPVRIMACTALLYQDLAERYQKRGETRGRIVMLERLLQHRFGAPLPEWVRPQLEGADAARLDHWAERIFDARSLEDRSPHANLAVGGAATIRGQRLPPEAPHPRRFGFLTDLETP